MNDFFADSPFIAAAVAVAAVLALAVAAVAFFFFFSVMLVPLFYDCWCENIFKLFRIDEIGIAIICLYVCVCVCAYVKYVFFSQLYETPLNREKNHIHFFQLFF